MRAKGNKNWKLSSWWKISQITVHCRFLSIITQYIPDRIFSMNETEYLHILHNIIEWISSWDGFREMKTTTSKIKNSVFFLLHLWNELNKSQIDTKMIEFIRIITLTYAPNQITSHTNNNSLKRRKISATDKW